ncbi:MAG: glycosyltransferase family 4 protein [Anaerolineae bacterium]
MAVGEGWEGLRRLAVVGPLLPRPGGVSVQTQSLAAALQGEGVEVVVVNTDLPSLRRWGPLGRALFPLVQPLVLAWRLWRRTRGCPIVHVQAASYWGFMPVLVAVCCKPFLGWGLVVTYHGHQAERFLRRFGWLARWALARADAVITLSGWAGERFRVAGIPNVEVPLLVPVERFPFRRRERLRPVCLWARHLMPNYHPEMLIRAAAEVRKARPEFQVLVVGGGPLREKVARLAEALDVPVTFLGTVPFEEMPRQYQQADIFLNTSNFDNFPTTLVEASACGLPVVTTDAGGIPYMVEDGVNALVVPRGDWAAMAQATLRLLDDPDLAARLSENGRRNAERCAWPAVRGRLLAVYRGVLEGRA